MPGGVLISGVAEEVRRGEVKEVLSRALPAWGGLRDLRPLDKGHGHQSFVLATGSGAGLLLKIARRTDQLDRMRSLGRTLELLAHHGVPVPRLVHFSAGATAFGGRPWLIQEFLDGEDGETALAGMSEAERAGFFRDFGRAVARLHAIDIGGFGDDLAAPATAATWAALVEARVGRLSHDHRGLGVLASPDLERASAVVLADARAISPLVRPAVVHRDLYLPNTLAAVGRFRCLLDFETARSWDAVADFVKLQMWVFEVVAGAETEFCAGYGGDPRATREGGLRYRVGLGLELLSGLAYWTRRRETAMFADYRRRFQQWLERS